MEEKMKGLDTIIEGVDKYCNDNGIEYLFAAVAEGQNYTRISHNVLTDAILKEAAKVIHTIIK